MAAEELRRMLAAQHERVAALEAALQRERARTTATSAQTPRASQEQQVTHHAPWTDEVDLPFDLMCDVM